MWLMWWTGGWRADNWREADTRTEEGASQTAAETPKHIDQHPRVHHNCRAFHSYWKQCPCQTSPLSTSPCIPRAKQELQEMREQGIIEEADSEWAH